MRASRKAKPTTGGASGEELAGGVIGLNLECLARVRDDERAAHRRAALLVGVRHLVGDQLTATRGPRLVLARGEEDVVPGRERARRDRVGERRGGRVGVHADVGDRTAERAAELGGERAVERLAAAARGSDRRLDRGVRDPARHDPLAGVHARDDLAERLVAHARREPLGRLLLGGGGRGRGDRGGLELGFEVVEGAHSAREHKRGAQALQVAARRCARSAALPHRAEAATAPAASVSAVAVELSRATPPAIGPPAPTPASKNAKKRPAAAPWDRAGTRASASSPSAGTARPWPSASTTLPASATAVPAPSEMTSR